MREKETQSETYTNQLIKEQRKSIKDKLKWMNPYAVHVKRVCEGKVLDIGCGIGRNLEYLGSRSLGVDHNEESIKFAQNRGLNAISLIDFKKDFENSQFDTFLMAHLLEHMTKDEAKELLKSYIKYLRVGGSIIVICPQEKGFQHDNTHIKFMQFSDIEEVLVASGIKVTRTYSFPFFRFFGKFYVFNEFIVIGKKV